MEEVLKSETGTSFPLKAGWTSRLTGKRSPRQDLMDSALWLEPYSLSENLADLKLWGRSTHSFSSALPDVRHFRVAGVTGYIPLVMSKGFILISGEPVCDADSSKVLLRALK